MMKGRLTVCSPAELFLVLTIITALFCGRKRGIYVWTYSISVCICSFLFWTYATEFLHDTTWVREAENTMLNQWHNVLIPQFSAAFKLLMIQYNYAKAVLPGWKLLITYVEYSSNMTYHHPRANRYVYSNLRMCVLTRIAKTTRQENPSRTLFFSFANLIPKIIMYF